MVRGFRHTVAGGCTFARFRLNRRAAVLCQVDKPDCRGRLASIWFTLYCGRFAGS